jgi:L-aminopeptidase/D-esterase-like protein
MGDNVSRPTAPPVLALLVVAAVAAASYATAAPAPAASKAVAAAAGPQDGLAPVINAGERVLRFDWPAISIGTGEYEEGPTGVTVFHFTKRASAAVDVRGGSPGTVNTDYLRQGYERPELDAVVFAGGSAYGLEATTAVQNAMKDDGLRGGTWDNIGFAAGAIIYDLGDRRLNEIYPDKRLAQAAYRAARAGVFPLGAQGAGRFAQNGRVFGCNVYSGQGGAFRQIGDLKIAAFVVVNAVGVVTARDGRVVACYRDPKWPAELRTADLFARYPATSRGEWPAAPAEPRGNTTISLIVTNRTLHPAQLQRLAAQVHTSMARAVQPFATEFDGDALYAVSTSELDVPPDPLEALELNVLASEVMWDAILASVPPQPPLPSPAAGARMPTAEDLRGFVGDYLFSPAVCLRVSLEESRLRAIAAGARPVYAIGSAAQVDLQPLGWTEFAVPGRYPLVLRFDAGGTLLVNPGHWQQVGVRRPGCRAAAPAAAK